VIRGPEKGKEGKVLKVLRKKNRVIIENVNLTKRHVKKGAQEMAQQDPSAPKQNYYYAPSPIHVSAVALVDPETGKPTKVGWKFLEDGRKVRVSKLSGAIIPKPKIERDLSAKTKVGPKDTLPEVVLRKTFDENTLNPLKLASIFHKIVQLQTTASTSSNTTVSSKSTSTKADSNENN
jgi:large subunit ribosomal protein L24